MKRHNQTYTIIIGALLFGLLGLYLWLSSPMNDQLRLNISFLVLVYIFVILPISIRQTRKIFFSAIGIELSTFRWWQILYYIFIFFCLLPFTLFVLGNSPDNPIKPSNLFNPYYVIPESFRFYLIVVSSTLGGLVLTASNNRHFNNARRQELINVAKKFIVATILLILFVVFYYNSNIFGIINPYEWEKNITPQGTYIAVMFWASVFCFYGGLILFLTGIIELIISLTRMGGARMGFSFKVVGSFYTVINEMQEIELISKEEKLDVTIDRSNLMSPQPYIIVTCKDEKKGEELFKRLEREIPRVLRM